MRVVKIDRKNKTITFASGTFPYDTIEDSGAWKPPTIEDILGQNQRLQQYNDACAEFLKDGFMWNGPIPSDSLRAGTSVSGPPELFGLDTGRPASDVVRDLQACDEETKAHPMWKRIIEAYGKA